MKWIGQHIYDQISRFRNDVYLEDLSTTTETSVLVVDSTGKVSKSTTLADDIIEAEIDTLAGLTSFGSAGATTDIAAGDLTMYNPVNDGAPTISIGSSATERLEIKALYASGTQEVNHAIFKTYTESTTGNRGRFIFYVDELNIMTLRDDGINMAADKGFSIAGTSIITDSNGTATLSNIDGLDATTLATIFRGPLIVMDPPDKTITPGVDGTTLHIDGCTYTDNDTDEGATSAAFNTVSIEGSTLAASHESTTTRAATLYIKDAVTAGTNKTITDTYALWVDSGAVKFDGTLAVGGTITGDVTGALTGNASGTAATVTAGTQAAITNCANLTVIGSIEGGVWNGTKITDIYTNSSGKRYGNTIKILPSDFITNDEGSVGSWFDDDTNTGIVVGDIQSEMWAFVTIPEGMTATAVDIYSNNSARTFKVYNMNVNANGLGDSLGTGTLNNGSGSALVIDVDSTATNFLAIKLDLNNITQRIRGGLVTIAPQ